MRALHHIFMYMYTYTGRSYINILRACAQYAIYVLTYKYVYMYTYILTTCFKYINNIYTYIYIYIILHTYTENEGDGGEAKEVNPVARVSEVHSAPRRASVMQRTREMINNQLQSGQVLRDRDIFLQMVMVLVAVIAVLLLFIGPLSRLTYYSFELLTTIGILIILIIFIFIL